MKPFLFTFLLTIVFIACKKNSDRPPTFVSYLKKGNTYYRLDAAVAFYDSVSPSKTVFSLEFHNYQGNQNFITFDFLLLENTYSLLPGNYSFKKAIPNSANFEPGRFLDVIIKCNTPVINSSADPATQASITLHKTEDNYTADGSVKINGEHYEVHFEGPIQHIKSW